MKISDIEVGGVYRGKCGEERRVIDIMRGVRESGTPFKVVWYIEDVTGAKLPLISFAAWAKERVR